MITKVISILLSSHKWKMCTTHVLVALVCAAAVLADWLQLTRNKNFCETINVECNLGWVLDLDDAMKSHKNHPRHPFRCVYWDILAPDTQLLTSSFAMSMVNVKARENLIDRKLKWIKAVEGITQSLVTCKQQNILWRHEERDEENNLRKRITISIRSESISIDIG